MQTLNTTVNYQELIDMIEILDATYSSEDINTISKIQFMLKECFEIDVSEDDIMFVHQQAIDEADLMLIHKNVK